MMRNCKRFSKELKWKIKMNKQKMIEWIATCDTGISSKTMWSALMGVKRKKDLDIPKDNSDFADAMTW